MMREEYASLVDCFEILYVAKWGEMIGVKGGAHKLMRSSIQGKESLCSYSC